MFDKKIDLPEVIMGLLLAALILYLFWMWVEKGYHQWDQWDRSTLTFDQDKEKAKRIKYLMTPNRWLADTVQPVTFYKEYYSAKYGYW